MTPNFTPSLGIALFDFVPVAFFLVSTFFFASFMKRHTNVFAFIVFLLGIALVNFAGFAKALWKLLLATGGENVFWMDDFQFLFMGIGLPIVFVSVLLVAIKQKKLIKNVPAAALILTVKGTNLFYYLLTIVVTTTIGYLSCLIVISKRLKCRVSVVFYMVYGVIAILMGALSGSGEMEIVNWIAQSINTIGTLALVIAHYFLNRKDKEVNFNQIEQAA